MENGDTLHLVERQPTQAQPSSASGGVEPSGGNVNQGTYFSSYSSACMVCKILEALFAILGFVCNSGVCLGPYARLASFDEAT